jgi:hypothetical protein
MRYLFAIVSGALLAILPAVILTMPDLAWWYACRNFVETSLAPQAIDAVIENPCGMTHRRPDEPIWMGVLNFSIVAISCAISGALAARMADERRLVIAFLAPFLGYVVLLFLGGPHWLAFVVGMFAGLLGMVGVGWQYLTNAWSATRSKQRAPQA